jgi:hypothetical protein
MAFDPKWTVGWKLNDLISMATKMGFKVNVLDISNIPTQKKFKYYRYICSIPNNIPDSSHINVKVEMLCKEKKRNVVERNGSENYVVAYVYKSSDYFPQDITTTISSSPSPEIYQLPQRYNSSKLPPTEKTQLQLVPKQRHLFRTKQTSVDNS